MGESDGVIQARNLPSWRVISFLRSVAAPLLLEIQSLGLPIWLAPTRIIVVKGYTLRETYCPYPWGFALRCFDRVDRRRAQWQRWAPDSVRSIVNRICPRELRYSTNRPSVRCRSISGHANSR